MEINSDDCIACGQCAEICTQEAIDVDIKREKGSQHYSRYKIDQGKCISCMECVEKCPNGAIYA